jgi:hypothetical protein
MSDTDIDKAYVSPYDKFMFEFDAKNEKSVSQLLEIKKHKRIFDRRDNADANDSAGEIWSDF